MPGRGAAGLFAVCGYGVLSYNLHVIGRELLARDGAGKPVRLAPEHRQTEIASQVRQGWCRYRRRILTV